MAEIELPRRAAGIWKDMPFIRGPQAQGFLVEVSALVREERLRCITRRERVLRHEWARRELCLLMGYERAEQWSGFVPPARHSQGDIYLDESQNTAAKRVREAAEYHANDSPFRKGLIELLRKVEQFEREAADDGPNPVTEA